MPWPFWRWLLAVLLAVAALITLLALARGHDSWISRGGHRNGAGEWCCGDGDCFVLPARQVSERADGYHIWMPTGAEIGSLKFEIVPHAEVQPSPDGAYWRCKRPDGSRRCFFAPPPNT